MESIFNQAFWINEWEKDKTSDTYAVHKGFSTSQYWDKASLNYDKSKKGVQDRRLGKTLGLLRQKGLLFEGMKVLEIGCGTGILAMALAKNGARVTALDFSRGMLDRFQRGLSKDLADKITLLSEDWHRVDIQKKGWEKQFDLVIAFMSPGVASAASFFKMLECSKNGCAIRGWAARRQNLILTDLWEKIMGGSLDDKPQSILFKINLLFSMGLFPDIVFDMVEWDQKIDLDEEFDNQMAFFSKVSDKPPAVLEKIIHEYLESISEQGVVSKKQKGLTATAVFSVNPLI
ncbi:MAG: methyltransferase domain-containing protein [Desulfobacteraceae bacterium]|nr:methyltransferase domain-containing protein [Desulfobacteraceae bacterium]